MSSISTGAEILVDSAVLKSTAESARKKISDMKKAQEALDSRVRGMDAYWKDGAEIPVSAVTEDMLRFYDLSMRYVSEPGDFEIFLGPDSQTQNKARFTLK